MLSIIVPTLNEVQELPDTLAHTRRAALSRDIELLVSDCGSRDGTCRWAGASKDVDAVITGGKSRAGALNRASARARGDILLFLHADSRLPDGFDRRITRAVDGGIVGGAFDFAFASTEVCSPVDRYLLEWVVRCNRTRFRCTGNFYGDQSIFVRREAFARIGGFPQVELMEDLDFSRRLKRLGRTAILRPPVLTSPRRFLARGIVRQFLEDLVLLGCHSMSWHPRGLSAGYNALNRLGHPVFAN